MVFSGVVNSNPLGTSCFVSGISISFKCECRIMQIQYTKNLNPGRFESGTTLSYGLLTWSGGPRSGGVGFFCFHALGDTKQKKPTPCKQTLSRIECFHMTSRRPYWCPKTMKRPPSWCPKPILWELNSFLMQMLSFVPINFHRCWSRE